MKLLIFEKHSLLYIEKYWKKANASSGIVAVLSASFLLHQKIYPADQNNIYNPVSESSCSWFDTI